MNFVSVIEAFEGHEAYSDDKTKETKQYIRPVEFKKYPDDLVEKMNIKERDVATSYSMHPNKYGIQAYASCVQEKIEQLGGYTNWKKLYKKKIDGLSCNRYWLWVRDLKRRAVICLRHWKE